jgi:hypothetical protein
MAFTSDSLPWDTQTVQHIYYDITGIVCPQRHLNYLTNKPAFFVKQTFTDTESLLTGQNLTFKNTDNKPKGAPTANQQPNWG